MTTVCPLSLYLQSSKATLEDIIIIRHGRTRNMYNNKTAAMTLAYIVEWQLFTLENEWSILFITILNYIFMIYHEYSWGEWWHILHHWYHFLYDKKLYETYLSTSHKTIQLYNKLSTANTLILCNTLERKKSK